MLIRHRDTVVLLLGFVSLLFLAATLILARRPLEIREKMLGASKRMEEAIREIRRCRERKEIGIDEDTDINRTGLIGLETSLITTSLGSLEAKRTTANPNFAGLVCLLLYQAGVRRGDPVAIGASSSFPALIIAALSAAEAMELPGLLICSLGASQWGANHPDFNWLDILACLDQTHLFSSRLVALSLGGEGDVGSDMSPEGRDLLLRRGLKTGLRFIVEADLGKNVEERLRIFEQEAGGSGIRAFVNIGGSYASMGTDSEVLRVGPGLASFTEIPPAERRGLIFAMAARGIPVIHLLYVKGLCDRYGLPWDPSPLPSPGQGRIFQMREVNPLSLVVLAAAYFVLLAAILAINARS